VRTLVVSDLHLGARRGVLARPEPLRLLLDALEDVDRLVLLGDVVESVGRRSMRAAEPVLRAIGRRMGPERAIVFVPGNHDRPLVRAWIRRRGPQLSYDDLVPADTSPGLAALTSWLAPARVSVRYPGAWLSDRLWATHGHYLDQHLLPESAFGVWRGLLGRPAQEEAAPRDYEGHGRFSRTRALAGAVPRPVSELSEGISGLIRASTMPLAPWRLLDPRFAGMTSRVLGIQMRRASIPALARVVHRLGIDADWVLFGHVHRLGPFGDDDREQWQGPDGRPRIANSGSWVYEPLLVHRAQPPHPYWPGGAIKLDGAGDPVAFGVLDHLPVRALR
jgi:predicted phosphodiesterase